MTRSKTDSMTKIPEYLNSFTRGDNCYQLWAQETKVLIRKCLSSSSLWTGLSAPSPPAPHAVHLLLNSLLRSYIALKWWNSPEPSRMRLTQTLLLSLWPHLFPTVYSVLSTSSPASPTWSPILLAFLKSLPTKLYPFLISVWMCPP